MKKLRIGTAGILIAFVVTTLAPAPVPGQAASEEKGRDVPMTRASEALAVLEGIGGNGTFAELSDGRILFSNGGRAIPDLDRRRVELAGLLAIEGSRTGGPWERVSPGSSRWRAGRSAMLSATRPGKGARATNSSLSSGARTEVTGPGRSGCEIIAGAYKRENLPAGAIAGLAVSSRVIEGGTHNARGLPNWDHPL